MADRPVSRFPVPALEDLPEDIRARILEVQQKAGFVPNVTDVFGRRHPLPAHGVPRTPRAPA